jgi:hypothetical protein
MDYNDHPNYRKVTMMDRFIRTKEFVVKHRASITGATGLAVGAVLTHRCHLTIYQRMQWGLGITSEQLQKLLDDPNYVVSYKGLGGSVNLQNIDLSKLQK